jgi:hypothetical protein
VRDGERYRKSGRRGITLDEAEAALDLLDRSKKRMARSKAG